ncbi:hypothetical protein CapIbe_009785 [Capra ibex]
MPSGKARLSTVCPVGLAPVLRPPLATSQGSREFLEAVSVILRTEVTSRVMSAFTMRETQMRRHGPPPHTRSSDGPWDTALQAAGVRMRGVSSTRGKREARWSRSRTVPRLRSQSVRVNRRKDDPSFSKAPLFRLLGGVGSVTALCLESLLERTRRGRVEPRRALPVGRPASRRDDRVVSHLGTRQPPLAAGPPLQSGPGQGLAGVLRASC